LEKNEPFYVYHFYVFWIAEFGGGAFAGMMYNMFIKSTQSDGKAESETFESINTNEPTNSDGTTGNLKIDSDL